MCVVVCVNINKYIYIYIYIYIYLCVCLFTINIVSVARTYAHIFTHIPAHPTIAYVNETSY